MILFVEMLFKGFSLIAGILTMAIMILPLVMRTTEEALRAVPDSFREGSFALGAGKLRTIFRVVLPSAMPGIIAGVILALGRVVGETAALIYTSGTVKAVPDSLFGSGETLAIHMYTLSSEGRSVGDSHRAHPPRARHQRRGGVHIQQIQKEVLMIRPELRQNVYIRGDAATPKFRVRELDLFYGTFQALKSVDMDIEANEITALIGPSGCGKSTFLKTLDRMNDIIPGCRISGKVELDGADIYAGGMDVNLLRKRDIVESSLRRAAIWDELKDRLKKSALGLSGGQQQRLCIARALAVKPDVLLMDEPTSALDPISTGKIEELAQELKKDYTIVIVTHNMQQAARISDKTGFFLLGELIEFGGTDEVFDAPRDKRTEDYITGRFG